MAIEIPQRVTTILPGQSTTITATNEVLFVVDQSGLKYLLGL